MAKLGRPGREVLDPCPVRSRQVALRNRRIKGAVTRKRQPLSQTEAARKYGVSCATVSLVVRNPESDKVAV